MGAWQLNKLVRSLAKKILLMPRRINAKQRALPDYLIIGAQKAGTTSLFSYINQHPQVRPPLNKEIHFFDLNYDRGVDWYRAHFPTISALRAAGAITGESSPYYLFHPHCARRIHDLLPDVKIIVLLRNPVERASAHYCHERKHGAESLSMEAAFRSEEQRIGAETQRLASDPDYRSFMHQHYSYLGRGRYAEQLAPYLELFPSTQLHILKAEDLFERPAEIVGGVYRFLGLRDGHAPHDLKARNAGRYPRRVDDALSRYLKDYYQEQNDRLAQLLGREWSW